MVTSTENPSEEEEIFSNTFKSQQQKQNNQKRIGIIGFGRLGRYLYFLKVIRKFLHN